MTIAVLILFAALTAADAWLTLRILDADGRELNPLVRKVMEKFGTKKGMAIVKVPTLILAAFLPLWLLMIVCALYVVVVGSNAKVYFNQKRGR